MRKRKLNWSIPYQQQSAGKTLAGQKCWAGKDGRFDIVAFIEQLEGSQGDE